MGGGERKGMIGQEEGEGRGERMPAVLSIVFFSSMSKGGSSI